MNIRKKIVLILALILVALLSMSKVADWATEPSNHAHSISEIDEKIKTVMELTAGATATSAALSFLPNDDCTPIAEEIAELAKYFLVVLSTLYLEKYLLTVTGFISFKILIPIACAAYGVGLFIKKDGINSFATKIIIGAIAIFMMVPASVYVSDLIYASYETSIDDTINTAKDISIENTDSEQYNMLTEWLTNSIGQARDYLSGLLSHFVEALAVMFVTTCVIPILVLILYVWIIKLLFGIDLRTKIPGINKTTRV